MKRKYRIKKCLAALMGIFFIGVGVAFNAMAQLGNDPVGIFYDGIRNTVGLTEVHLGLASNLVNLVLTGILLIVGKKYINLGTLIYILPYGTFVTIGTHIYAKLFIIPGISYQIAASVCGCLGIYLGVAMFIAADIGLDPMTALTMVVKDKLHWDFKRAKVLFDVCLTLLGVLLGGKLGAITIITALSAGPVIQLIAERLTGLEKGRKEHVRSTNEAVSKD